MSQPLRPYRVIKLVQGQPDALIEEGESGLSDAMLKQLKPDRYREGWDNQRNFGIAFDIKKGRCWKRMAEFPHQPVKI